MRPPIRIDVSQRTFLGFTYRQIAIFVFTAIVTIGLFGLLKLVPLFVRGGLAVLCAGLGLAMAFGEIEGKTPEAWLWGLLRFRRRSRFMLHRAMRGADDARRVAWPNTDSGATSPTPAFAEAMPAEVALPRPSFFLLSANAIGLSILVSLTIWLIQGGAYQLQLVLTKSL